jgi:hypothetical protein
MKFVIVSIALMSGNVFAGNANHGPIPDNAKIERIRLTKLSCASRSESDDGEKEDYLFVVSGKKESRLQVSFENGTHSADLTVAGEPVLPSTDFSDFGMFPMAYSADLNRDKLSDFVIESYSAGCGLAAGYCNVAFVLSSKKGKYTLTSVTTLFPDEGDFLTIGGKRCFIHASLLGVSKCNDRKPHNFWIYNLLVFGKDGVKMDNSIHPDFPKTIWYTFKPNHTETSIITDEQKDRLRKRSLTRIFWKKETKAEEPKKTP